MLEHFCHFERSEKSVFPRAGKTADFSPLRFRE